MTSADNDNLDPAYKRAMLREMGVKEIMESAEPDSILDCMKEIKRNLDEFNALGRKNNPATFAARGEDL